MESDFRDIVFVVNPWPTRIVIFLTEVICGYLDIYCIKLKIKIKSVAYSSQGSHTGQLDFCNWLADSSTTG